MSTAAARRHRVTCIVRVTRSPPPVQACHVGGGARVVPPPVALVNLVGAQLTGAVACLAAARLPRPRRLLARAGARPGEGRWTVAVGWLPWALRGSLNDDGWLEQAGALVIIAPVRHLLQHCRLAFWVLPRRYSLFALSIRALASRLHARIEGIACVCSCNCIAAVPCQQRTP